MGDFETWNAFRRGESARTICLPCCECGKPAEGNVSCDDGEICDACHLADELEHVITRDMSEDDQGVE